MKPAVEVTHLSKRYTLGQRKTGYKTLRESIMNSLAAAWSRRAEDRPDPQEFWALRDVSFGIRPGEVVGLLGRNGAGKSTLLKVLSRITEPTSGRAVVRGRMGSLLEVGTGFHNELTGRENIYLNGSILGMSRQEIAKRFDEIVAFSEMEQFLDTPVKRYSSGMFVRLAFAVAAHLDLDTLLVDEVLAVGDLDFQKKCLAKMGSITNDGKTIIFVSHNLGQIHRLCDRAILIQQGAVIQDGPVADVITAYLKGGQAGSGRWDRPEGMATNRDVYIRSVRVLDASGNPSATINCDAGCRVAIEYEVTRTTPNFEVSFYLRNGEGIKVLTSLDSDTAEWPDRSRPPGTYRSTAVVPGHLLAPGTYYMSAAAHIINQLTFEHVQDVLAFEVSELGCVRSKRNDTRSGLITPVFDWEVTQA